MIKYSIIIPVKEINSYIRETVAHILCLDNDSWELLILPNEADLTEWDSIKIKILPTGNVGPATKRDVGARHSKGQILVFLDDDSYPEKNLLSIANEHIDNENTVAIGGPGITPHDDSFWQKVSGAVFLSKFSGGAPERYISTGNIRAVVDWPSVNLIVKKEYFIKVGGFDTNYWPGEDTKLCLDLMKATNKKILYIPQMIVWHHRRSGLFRHLKQIGGYGLHRGFFVKKYPETSRKLKYFLPSILVLYISIIAIFPLFIEISNILYLPLCIYLMVMSLALIDIGSKTNIRIAFASIPYIFLTHFYYGIKFIQGLISGNVVSKLR